MAITEKDEPTPTEIMEELRKHRDETIRKIEGSSIAVWLTPAVFGGSITLFGLARLPEGELSAWLPFVIAGLGLMVWARAMTIRAQRQFRDKWHEPPPKF